jgi:hypothetical protein
VAAVPVVQQVVQVKQDPVEIQELARLLEELANRVTQDNLE